jgi:hypothetical protein
MNITSLQPSDPENINPNWFSGLTTGILNLFDLGELYDLKGDLQKEVNTAQDIIDDNRNQNFTFALKALIENNQELFNLLNEQYVLLNKKINFNNILSFESIYQTNLFIKVLFILLLLVLIYIYNK